jgi:hypothetical protein
MKPMEGYIMFSFFKKINLLTIRDWCLMIAEVADAWRLAPRVSLSAYAYLLWFTIEWYMKIINPTTQQTALVTTVAGLAAVIFAFYVNTGRKWSSAPDYVSSEKDPSTMDKDATLKLISDKVDQLSSQITSQVVDAMPEDEPKEQ